LCYCNNPPFLSQSQVDWTQSDLHDLACLHLSEIVRRRLDRFVWFWSKKTEVMVFNHLSTVEVVGRSWIEVNC
jgi:hypothetical protein